MTDPTRQVISGISSSIFCALRILPRSMLSLSSGRPNLELLLRVCLILARTALLSPCRGKSKRLFQVLAVTSKNIGRRLKREILTGTNRGSLIFWKRRAISPTRSTFANGVFNLLENGAKSRMNVWRFTAEELFRPGLANSKMPADRPKSCARLLKAVP